MYIIDEDAGTVNLTYSLEQIFDRVMMRGSYKSQAMRDNNGIPITNRHAPSMADSYQIKDFLVSVFGQIHEKMSAYSKGQDTPFDISDDDVEMNIAPHENWDWSHVLQLDSTIVNTAVIGGLYHWYEMIADPNNAKAYKSLYESNLSHIKSIVEKRKTPPSKGYNIF